MTLTNSSLLNCNKQLLAKDGIYSLPNVAKAEVVFFDEDEDHALRVISSLDDLSSHSAELEEKLSNHWNVTDLLSDRSYQYLYAFDFSQIDRVLEVGADFGGVSRYCAERAQHVDVLKNSLTASKGSQYRCSDLTNVDYVCENFTTIELPCNAYDLIILSDLEREGLSDDELRQFIEKLSDSLTEKGILSIKCSNPNAVSKLFDESESVPYQALYHDRSGEYSLKEWQSNLLNAGLVDARTYSVLPNLTHCRTLLSHDYMQENAHVVNHFYGAGLIQNEHINEYLFFDHASKKQSLDEVSNAYLILASKKKNQLKQFFDYDFLHVSSSGRKRQWRTFTTLATSANAVEKRALFPADQIVQSAAGGFSVQQDLSPQSFQSGESLAGQWLRSTLPGAKGESLFDCFCAYYAWLQKAVKTHGPACYDMLPFNIVVDENKEFQIIDPEWLVEGDYDAEFIYFRAIFWFVFHNRAVLVALASEQGLFSIHDFIAYALKQAGIEADISEFAIKETVIQSQIEKQFNKNAIEDTLRLPLSNEFSKMEVLVDQRVNAQLFFYDETFDIENSYSTKLAVEGEVTKLDVSELDTTVRYLRIDPVDRKGFFHLREIVLRDKSGNILWELQGEAEIVRALKPSNLVFNETELGNLFVALNDDPQMILDLSKVADASKLSLVELDVSYRETQDYLIAMNKFGNESVLQKAFINQLNLKYSDIKRRYDVLSDQSELVRVLSHEVVAQRESVAALTDMLNRKLSRRIKGFIARRLGIKLDKETEVDDPAEIEDQVPIEETTAESEPESNISELGQNNKDYKIWVKENSLTSEEITRIRVEVEQMAFKPTISIVVPVYNIEEEYLDMAVNSVITQLYPHWQLCLVDDASPKHHIRPVLRRMAAKDSRISIQLNKVNGGIGSASNDGLGISKGDYVGLLDHDDELTIDALYENAKLINQNPEIDFIYSDEDKLDMKGKRVDPFFKPDFSPDLLESQNYICHFSVFSGRVLQKIGGFRKGFDGSQDHDIIFRVVGQAKEIAHIPKVLYHWRKVPGSTADVYDSKSYAWEAGRLAVEQRVIANQEKAVVELGPLQGTYRVKREIIGNPKVSIVIPFKDKPELLAKCVSSILERTTYENYEIIGVSNNSEQVETSDLMKLLSDENENIQFVEKNVPFNFSQICNFGVEQSTGDYVLLLNNDIEVINSDWLDCLLGYAQRSDVGAVGGKLYYPDGRIQHAGVVAGMHGAAGHKLLYFSGEDTGYYGSLKVTSNVSAVTGAMLLVSRAKYDEVGGLDEENLAVAYNDVDLCLKLLDKGYLNVFTPFCSATHHESASRGYEDSSEKLARLDKERAFFVNKWQDRLAKGDPYFNSNFDLSKHDLTLKLKEVSSE